MSNSIKISPKHGVNPTLPVCFFCGKDKGEIALLGHIKARKDNGKIDHSSDIEAPMRMVLNYEPCDECKANMAMGTTIIEVVTKKDAPNNRMEIAPGAIPTGSWNVIKNEAFERIFKDMISEKLFNNVIESRKLLLDHNIFQSIFCTSPDEN